MTCYLDCEFDGFGGALVSMAIVSTDGDEFYEVVRDWAIDDWVKESVLPFLAKAPIDEIIFRERLADFLLRHEDETIIADFPCDFRYLLQMITLPAGRCLRVSLNMQLYHGLETAPEVRHNALSDAKALMFAHKLALDAPVPPLESVIVPEVFTAYHEQLAKIPRETKFFAPDHGDEA